MYEEILKWIILLLLLLLYFWWMNKLSQGAREERSRAYGSGDFFGEGDNSGHYEQEGSSEDAGSFEDHYRRMQEARERALERKAKRISQMLGENPDLIRDVSEVVGVDSLSPEELNDPEVMKELARRLSDDLLDILEVSGKGDVLKMDLESGTSLREVESGGHLSDLAPLTDMSDVRQRKRSEYGLPRSLRMRKLLTGEAQRVRYLEIVDKKKILYVLEDGSGSMRGSLRDGKSRFVFARGVIYRLAKQALSGKSKFVYRLFDASPKPMRSVISRNEASDFLRYLTSYGSTGGGTNIWAALERAVGDIKRRSDITEADILLISDGEDGSIGDVSQLKQLLGKVRLRVIVIGSSNPSLKEVATSYKEIH